MEPTAPVVALIVAAFWIALGIVGIITHRDARRAVPSACLTFVGIAVLASARGTTHESWLAISLGAIVVALGGGFTLLRRD